MDAGVWVKALVNWLHLSAAVVWLGAIFTAPLIMARALGPEPEAARSRLRGRYYTAFSPVAWAALALLTLTGTVRAAAHLENGWHDLWATPWGKLLFLKLAAVAALVWAGAYSTYRLAPRIAASERRLAPGDRAAAREAAKRLHRLNLASVALGLFILLIVTFL